MSSVSLASLAWCRSISITPISCTGQTRQHWLDTSMAITIAPLMGTTTMHLKKLQLKVSHRTYIPSRSDLLWLMYDFPKCPKCVCRSKNGPTSRGSQLNSSEGSYRFIQSESLVKQHCTAYCLHRAVW